jgi:Zn-dependent protease with chaperone function
MFSICEKCGHENGSNSLFCSNCSSILRQRTSYDITAEDFIFEGDKDAFEILESTGLLYHILNTTIIKPRLTKLIEKLLKGTKQLESNNGIKRLIEECADVLSLESLPEVRLGELGQKNAFTTGMDEQNIIIIDKGLAYALSYDEMKSLLGHEMGHIKSRHLMYHSIAEILERGIEFSSSLIGMNLISIPMRLTLKAWHRESEFSADRASLIVTNNLKSIASMFIKLIGSQTNIPSNLESLFEVLSTHPTHHNRINELKKFEDSIEFANIKKKLELRKTLGRAFISNCRFCGSQKSIDEIFCPICGRSLA